jgi:hypothetical protein
MANLYIASFLYLLKRLERQLRNLSTLLAQASIVRSHLKESWTALYVVQEIFKRHMKKL